MANKKKNGANGTPSFNPRSMERMMRDLTKMLEQQNFESIEEANEFLAQFTGKPLPELPISDDPVAQANELVFQAYDADTMEEALVLANKALDTSPDCADAYVFLAEVDAFGNIDKAHEYYQKGVDAGKRVLGKKFFKENEGYFWGIHETRPFMRAMAGLAETTWLRGDGDEAIKLYREMLRLNPHDNQGVRYQLVHALIEDERFEEVMQLLKEFEEDAGAIWSYSRALTIFSMEGECEESNTALKEAIESNPHVPDFLLGKAKMPTELPPYVGFGDESEAVEYAIFGIVSWRTTFGAVKWLRNQTKSKKPKSKRKKR